MNATTAPLNPSNNVRKETSSSDPTTDLRSDVKLLHLPVHNSLELHASLVRAFGELPAPLRRTLTWDQGTEMARHLDITADTGARIYFCDAASPWQRGSNENANGLLDWSPEVGLWN